MFRLPLPKANGEALTLGINAPPGFNGGKVPLKLKKNVLT
jgi:hypothetical protein